MHIVVAGTGHPLKTNYSYNARELNSVFNGVRFLHKVFNLQSCQQTDEFEDICH